MEAHHEARSSRRDYRGINGTREAYHENTEAHHGTIPGWGGGFPWSLWAIPEDLRGSPEELEAHPGAVDPRSLPGSLKVPCCAAKAFYSCPAIISQRLESRIISKEPQENTEEESKIIQARSHINSEKSSRNYKPSDEWAKPNFTPDVKPPPKPVLGCVFWRLCTWWVPGLAL